MGVDALEKVRQLQLGGGAYCDGERGQVKLAGMQLIGTGIGPVARTCPCISGVFLRSRVCQHVATTFEDLTRGAVPARRRSSPRDAISKGGKVRVEAGCCPLAPNTVVVTVFPRPEAWSPGELAKGVFLMSMVGQADQVGVEAELGVQLDGAV